MGELITTTVYLDSDFCCHLEPGEGLTPYETSFFSGWEQMIPNYRIVPEGMTWVRQDGEVFTGEMIARRDDGQTSIETILSSIEEALNG